MRKRNRKRAAPRVVIIDWTEDLAEIFSLPLRLALKPPATAKVVVTTRGSTWSARFTNQYGEPVGAHVRLRHGALPITENPVVVEERINMKFIACGPLKGREGTVVIDEFADLDDAAVAKFSKELG